MSGIKNKGGRKIRDSAIKYRFYFKITKEAKMVKHFGKKFLSLTLVFIMLTSFVLPASRTAFAGEIHEETIETRGTTQTYTGNVFTITCEGTPSTDGFKYDNQNGYSIG